MTYIYLNTYENGCLYVGSHTWDGEGIDPNYKGSSGLAKRHGWEPDSITLLEVVSEERKYTAEREWIEKYCTEYGIFPTVKFTAHEHNNYWVDQFKDGVLLNGHCNTLEQAIKNGHSPEACEKQFLTRSKREDYHDIYARATITRRNNGYGRRCVLNDGFIGFYADLKEHTGLTQSMVGVAMTMAFRRGSYTTRSGWVFQPYYDGTEFDNDLMLSTSTCAIIELDGVVGTIHELSEKLNIKYTTLVHWFCNVKNNPSYAPKRGVHKGKMLKILK